MAGGTRQQKKLCCSKKIMVVSYVVTGLLTATLVLGVFLAPAEISLSPVEVVTGLAWGETAVATGFYYTLFSCLYIVFRNVLPLAKKLVSLRKLLG